MLCLSHHPFILLLTFVYCVQAPVVWPSAFYASDNPARKHRFLRFGLPLPMHLIIPFRGDLCFLVGCQNTGTCVGVPKHRNLCFLVGPSDAWEIHIHRLSLQNGHWKKNPELHRHQHRLQTVNQNENMNTLKAFIARHSCRVRRSPMYQNYKCTELHILAQPRIKKRNKVPAATGQGLIKGIFTKHRKEK